MSERHVPEVIRVVRQGSQCRIEIDGELFPFFTAPGGWNVDVDRKEMPGVRVTLVAHRVEVVNDASGKAGDA